MDPAFAFRTAQEIRFGRGAAAGAAEAVAALAPRALLVRGGDAGRAAWLRRDLAAAGVETAEIACPREPDLDRLDQALRLAREAGAGAVVALGGGSAIDLGKAAAALTPGSGAPLDHLEVVGEGRPLSAAPLPFVAIPTTAGTGAEVTRNAVIAAPEARRKASLRDPRMLPALALVDPALTDAAPRGATLGPGLDALTQVIEPYLSTRANRLTDALCREAIPLALRALPRLMRGEDPAARDDMAWVSLCGGLALANAGLGVVHGLAGPLGGRFPGAPHGAVCGALLPAALEATAQIAPEDGPAAERLAELRLWIAAALGGPPEEAFASLAAWARGCGAPGLRALGADPAAYPELAEAAGRSSSMRGAPARLDPPALVRLLEAAG